MISLAVHRGKVNENEQFIDPLAHRSENVQGQAQVSRIILPNPFAVRIITRKRSQAGDTRAARYLCSSHGLPPERPSLFLLLPTSGHSSVEQRDCLGLPALLWRPPTFSSNKKRKTAGPKPSCSRGVLLMICSSCNKLNAIKHLPYAAIWPHRPAPGASGRARRTCCSSSGTPALPCLPGRYAAWQ